MIWEYLIVGGVVCLAVAYLWKVFIRQKGCSCDSCPGAQSTECGSCSVQGGVLDDLREKEHKPADEDSPGSGR